MKAPNKQPCSNLSCQHAKSYHGYSTRHPTACRKTGCDCTQYLPPVAKVAKA